MGKNKCSRHDHAKTGLCFSTNVNIKASICWDCLINSVLRGLRLAVGPMDVAASQSTQSVQPRACNPTASANPDIGLSGKSSIPMRSQRPRATTFKVKR